MRHLNKDELLTKLLPYGITTLASLNRLIREQRLPCKCTSPRKVFFDESDVDLWLSRRNPETAQANIKRAKEEATRRKIQRKLKAEKAGKDGKAVKPVKIPTKTPTAFPVSASVSA